MFNKAGELRTVFNTEPAENSNDLIMLSELLEIQQALDEAIYRDKNIKEYPEEKVEIALFVELGELLNELPSTFKYWKEQGKDNREKALIEYVDCLHFALSLTNFNAESILKALKDQRLEVEDYSYSINSLYSTKDTGDLHYLLQEITTTREEVKIGYLFDIGNILGFKWEEICKAYKEKNAVNYKRLQSGY